jgi:hypothetical protein
MKHALKHHENISERMKNKADTLSRFPAMEWGIGVFILYAA